MKKKNHKEKQIHIIIKQRKCALCKSLTPVLQILHLPQSTLQKKYYTPQIETFYYRETSNILYDPYCKQSINFVQMCKIAFQKQSLDNYYEFAEIVKNIKPLVNKRVDKDFYGWVDFRKQHYKITNYYYIKQKHLRQNNQKMIKYLKSTGSAQSTGQTDDRYVRQFLENKIKKELDTQRIIKHTQNQTNSSTIQMQRLTKNLEDMIEKIGDCSCRPTLTMGAKYRNSKIGGKHKNMEEILFKRHVEKQISAINKNSIDDLPLEFEHSQKFPQTYGLDMKPKNKSKKLSKLNLKSLEKTSGFDKLPPQTPKPRFYHANNEYDDQDIYKDLLKSKGKKSSRQKIFHPMSPGNRSSSISQKKSSLLKNSTQKSTSKKIRK